MGIDPWHRSHFGGQHSVHLSSSWRAVSPFLGQNRVTVAHLFRIQAVVYKFPALENFYLSPSLIPICVEPLGVD